MISCRQRTLPEFFPDWKNRGFWQLPNVYRHYNSNWFTSSYNSLWSRLGSILNPRYFKPRKTSNKKQYIITRNASFTAGDRDSDFRWFCWVHIISTVLFRAPVHKDFAQVQGLGNCPLVVITRQLSTETTVSGGLSACNLVWERYFLCTHFRPPTHPYPM